MAPIHGADEPRAGSQAAASHATEPSEIGLLQRTYRRLRFGQPIVVVSGLPRSGTSMLMRMLEAGGMATVSDGTRRADEDNPRGYFEDERVKKLTPNGDRAWLLSARGKAIKVVSPLLDCLPDSNNYRVLFMNRDLDEVLASQAKMLARRGEPSKTDDARMRMAFLQHLKKAKADLRARPCFDVLELDYEGVVAAPRQGAAAIREFLGRSLDVDAMAAAVEADLYRNRRSQAGGI